LLLEGEVLRRLAAVCQLEVVVSRKGSSKVGCQPKNGRQPEIGGQPKSGNQCCGSKRLRLKFGSCCG